MTEPAHPLAGVYGRQSRNKAKSIAEQVNAGIRVAVENGWPVADTYQDGTSASRYARKGRDDWPRVLADIEAGAFTVLILWESSRGDRTLTTWSALLDLCRDKGVSIYIISDERLYDPRKARDWKTLATAGVDSASESDVISARVLRGQAGSAAAGRPSHGRTPFGYARRYDPNTGELLKQEIDPAAAKTVREIFRRLAKGEAVSTIVKDFNRRQVPTVGAVRWYRVRVRDIAMNRAYIGERMLNGSITPGIWPALVKPEQFHTVQRVLTNPARTTTRPGRVVHLLSYLGTAAPCGGQLTAVRGRYRCLDDGCVTIVQAETDDLVERRVLARLEQPDVYQSLRQAGADNSREAQEARDEADRLGERLNEWRQSAIRGETTPATMAVVEADLTGQINALRRRARAAEVPAELQLILGTDGDVRARWRDAPMPVRRRVIAHVASIVVGPSAAPGSRPFDFWRLGQSRWAGDPMTWGELWAEGGL